MDYLMVSRSSTVEVLDVEAGRIVKAKVSKAQMALCHKLYDNEFYESLVNYLHSFNQNTGPLHRPSARRIKADGFDKLANHKPNRILEMIKQRFNPKLEKKPKDFGLGDWMGVEIECFIPGSNMKEVLSKEVIERKIPGVRIVEDGSIRAPDVEVDEDGVPYGDSDDYTELEFTIVFNRHDPSPLKALCELLRDYSADVNSSCGLHVHLDMRDVLNTGELATRVKRLGKSLPVLTKMVPPSRLTNHYCRPAVSCRTGRRYFAINQTAVAKHGTVEVRLHSGTIHFNKIWNWAQLLFLISRQRGLLSRKIQHYSDLSEALPKASRELMEYVKARIILFNSETMLYRPEPVNLPQAA